MNVTVTTCGYELREPDGTFVSWHEYPEDATRALRTAVRGSHVVRCADGILIATASPRTQRRT